MGMGHVDIGDMSPTCTRRSCLSSLSGVGCVIDR